MEGFPKFLTFLVELFISPEGRSLSSSYLRESPYGKPNQEIRLALPLWLSEFWDALRDAFLDLQSSAFGEERLSWSAGLPSKEDRLK